MTHIPITIGFGSGNIIGFMHIDEAKLPSEARFTFALGVTAQLKGAVGEVPREQLSGPYTLHEVSVVSDEKYGAYLAQVGALAPIPMVLFCPMCGVQHIDRDESPSDREWAAQSASDREQQYWTNPPHKSHLCHACGCIWRPADVATVGVRSIATKGERDNFHYVERFAMEYWERRGDGTVYRVGVGMSEVPDWVRETANKWGVSL